MLLKHDNSNKNKYSFDFYYNFLYSGKSQDFLFFLNSCYSDLGSGNSSFIFLTFGLLLIPLAHFLSWYFFNFTFKIFYYILNVYVLIYNFSELFCIWIFFFLHEHILLFIMEIKPSSVPCTAPVSSAFPVCVCMCICVCVCVCVYVFSFCFCLGLYLPCWKVFSSVLGSSALNLFSRANHKNANLITRVNGSGRISHVGLEVWELFFAKRLKGSSYPGAFRFNCISGGCTEWPFLKCGPVELSVLWQQAL